MPEVPAIQPLDNPLTGLIRLQELQGLAQERQMRGQEFQARAQELQQRQQQMQAAQAAQQRASQVWQNLPRTSDDLVDVPALMQQLGSAGAAPKDMEGFATTAEKMNQIHTSYRQQQKDHLADLANVLLEGHDDKNPVTQDSIHLGLAAARGMNLATDDDVQQLTNALSQGVDPNHVLKTVRGLGSKWAKPPEIKEVPQGGTLVSITPSGDTTTLATGQPKPLTSKTELQLAAAKGDPDAQAALAREEKLTPYQQAEIGLAQQRARTSAGQLAVAQQRLQMDTQAPDLTEEGLNAVAEQFAKTGQMPPMGMGKKAAELRAKIINRAAEQKPGLDLATAQADFAANKGSLNAIQKQRDAVVAFEQTANQNLDRFLDTAKGVIDTGSPLLNAPLRTVSGSVFGSQNKAAFDAARLVAQNEIAKVVNNPNLSGQLSNAARKEVESAMSPDATLKQIYAVAKVLRSDMAARRTSLDQQIGAINTRIKTGGAVAPSAPSVQDPLGIR